MKLRTVVPLLLALITAPAVGVVVADRLDQPEDPKPAITLAGDSVVTSWNSVQTASQPIARYELELRKVSGDTLLVSAQTTALFSVQMLTAPAVGDSLVIYAKVRAVNTRGKAGPYGTSAPFTLRTTDPGPAAPQPVIRDTTGVIVPPGGPSDTTTFIAFNVAQTVTPQPAPTFTMTVGDVVEACFYFVIDGGAPIPAPNPTWQSSDPAAVAIGVVGPTGNHCRELVALSATGAAQLQQLARLGRVSIP